MPVDPNSLTAYHLQLHLEVLNAKRTRSKGKMNICQGKMDMDNPGKKGIDVEHEALMLEKHKQDFETFTQAISDYEDKVLALTEL